MARSRKQLIGKFRNEEGDVVWVYKGGRDFWISYKGEERICHPSVRSVDEASREAFLVFHVDVPIYEGIDKK